tara:strand:+ start:3176 stop:3346 length:171 start_codon:yes stop_codon:yes gene_type:complete
VGIKAENPGTLWRLVLFFIRKLYTLKMNGNNFTWIKIDASYPKDPKLISYALENKI